MSAKQFNLMAQRLTQITSVSARRIAAEAFADVAAQSNARFNRAMFLTACGL